jgi:threonine dehydratase
MSTSASPDLAMVVAAAERIAGSTVATPCVFSRALSDRSGAEVWLKFENLQYTGAFKERGALAKLSTLDGAARSRGVIAMSAGNHAQGVAYHAGRLGIPACVVMPRFTPNVKVAQTTRFGARVVLSGDDFDAARATAMELCEREQLTLIHPYDDPQVIAGQGTIGLELVHAVAKLEVIVVPVGGGGLISGIAIAARGLRPSVQVIGVQSERYPSMWCQRHGEDRPIGGATIAEGIAVKRAGELTSAIVQREVDDLLLVGEADIERAVLTLLENEKTVTEGAGACAVAALLRHAERFAGKCVTAILSGGNIDPMLLAEIIERGMVRDQRLVRLRVGVRDLPGALAAVTAKLAEAGANIVEVHHERQFSHLPLQHAEIGFTVMTRDANHVAAVLDHLRSAGMSARLTGDGNTE